MVGESTFCSYDLAERERVMQLARDRGVELLTVPARGNTKRRAAAGFPEKTGQSRQTDREDALAIRNAALTGAHLKRPAIPEPAWVQRRDDAERAFVQLRRSGRKDAYAYRLTQHLYGKYPFSHQPAGRRIALGSGTPPNYNLVLVAAVGIAAKHVSSRGEFERLMGLYAHGYPCQFRSDVYHWGWNRQVRKREAISLSVYRRELRWLFHQLKSLQQS